MEKQQHSKIMSFLNISHKAKIPTIPKTLEKWKEKIMGKHKHFKVKGFLSILREADFHAIPEAWDEWIPILQNKCGKVQDNSQLLLFFTDFKLMGNCAIPNVWECTNSHNMEIFCKISYFQDVGVWGNFFKKLLGNPTNSHAWVKWNVYYENIKRNTTLFPCYGLWLNIYQVRQLANIPNMGN